MNELDKLIQQLIKEKGGTKQKYLHLLNSIAEHETGGTMDPFQKQIGGGPGRGKYQFEVGKNRGATTAARRLQTYYNKTNIPVPKWLKEAASKDSLDATDLTSEQQDLLFLGNMREHPRADLGKVVNGEESVPEFWANYHWAGKNNVRDSRLKNFKETYKEFKELPVEYDKNVTELSQKKDATLINNINNFPKEVDIQSLQPRKVNTSIPLEQEFAYGGATNTAQYQRTFTSYGVGGTHESNPNGGVKLGPNASVEQGESSYNFKDLGKFIFSDRINLNSAMKGESINPTQFAEGGPTDPPVKPIKDSSNLEKRKDNTNTNFKEVLNLEDLKLKKQSKEKYNYYNPEVKPNITTGDWKQDLLYNNQWLIDTPIVGDYIKKQAKDIASKSNWDVFVEDINEVQSREQGWNGTTNLEGTTVPLQKTSLLDQYFSKEPLLPKSKYKPSSDYLEFLPSYSLKTDSIDNSFKGTDKFTKVLAGTFFDEKEYNDIANDDFNDIQKKLVSSNKYKKFLKDKQPIYFSHDENSNWSGVLDVDLGGHKTGIAWDKEKNLPYVSITDAWDFSPKDYSKKWKDVGNTYMDKDKDNSDKMYIQSSLMHKAGNPFKVYDRFYFDPKTQKYLTDEEVKNYGNKKKK